MIVSVKSSNEISHEAKDINVEVVSINHETAYTYYVQNRQLIEFIVFKSDDELTLAEWEAVIKKMQPKKWRKSRMNGIKTDICNALWHHGIISGNKAITNTYPMPWMGRKLHDIDIFMPKHECQIDLRKEPTPTVAVANSLERSKYAQLIYRTYLDYPKSKAVIQKTSLQC